MASKRQQQKKEEKRGDENKLREQNKSAWITCISHGTPPPPKKTTVSVNVECIHYWNNESLISAKTK